jgi:hypothetical protein
MKDFTITYKILRVLAEISKHEEKVDVYDYLSAEALCLNEKAWKWYFTKPFERRTCATYAGRIR